MTTSGESGMDIIAGTKRVSGQFNVEPREPVSLEREGRVVRPKYGGEFCQ